MTKTIKKTHIVIAITGSITLLTGALMLHAHRKNAAMQPITITLPKVYLAEQNTSSLTNQIAEANAAMMAATSPNLPNMAVQQHKITIKSHDSLRSILHNYHIAQEDVKNVLKLRQYNFKTLTPKQIVELAVDQEHHLLSLKLPLAPNKTLYLTRNEKGFKQKVESLPLTTNLVYKSGVILSTPTKTMQNAGMTSKMYQQFVSIFKGQINFARDIHRGDHFAILHEEYYLNGQKYRPGDIVAAELTTKDNHLRAVRFSYSKDHSGYYTPKGNSLEARFLSYPLHFKKISSHFSYNRIDPISHLNRPHLGIDFSASNGTPVQSIGNGRITYIGNTHGYGRMIKISFDSHYSAMYAHLERFASNLKLHQEIRKGQTIGYVGSTGWSTGPHLHFGFYLDGVAKNWLAMKPTGSTIPSRYFKKFLATSHRILAALEFHQAPKFAANNNNQITPPEVTN